ncbi:MAG: hypothetical protein Q8P18_19215 [Pseudomonadota bacterium]|nr:hypothetical protein [Pseudomonadota bacterium]
MATTFQLRVWTRFLAPREDVWALKTDAAAIEAEFRPWMSFCLPKGDELARALGGAAPVDLPCTLRIGRVLPIAWPARLESAVLHESFRDTSTNALYSRFEHDHLFEVTPDGCRYIDSVTFTSTSPAQKWFAIATQRLFQHRHTVAAKRLPTDPQATAISVLRVLVEEEAA